MSAFGCQQQPIRQGSGGARSDRAACPRSGPRRAPGTLRGTSKVYGATPTVSEVVAEAQVMGAGSHELRGYELRNGRPHGSAAGDTEGCSAHRRCTPRIDRRRWSR